MMPRRVAHVFALLTTLLTVAAQTLHAQDKPTEWEPGGRQRLYIRSLIGPGALASSAISAGIAQSREDPPQWEQDLGGYGQRFASTMGRNAVQETVRHGLAAAFSRSVEYRKCECTAFFPRVGNALIEAVTDRNRNGARSINFSRVVGAYAGAEAEALWRPDRESNEIFAAAASTFLYGALGNLWKEFIGWP